MWKWYKTTYSQDNTLDQDRKLGKMEIVFQRGPCLCGLLVSEWHFVAQLQSFVPVSVISDNNTSSSRGNNHVSIWGINSKFIQLQWDKHNLMHAMYGENKVTASDWWKFHRSACWGRTVKDHRCQPDAAPTSVVCHPLSLILLKCNVPAEVTDHERTLESDPDLLGTQLSV